MEGWVYSDATREWRCPLHGEQFSSIEQCSGCRRAVHVCARPHDVEQPSYWQDVSAQHRDSEPPIYSCSFHGRATFGPLEGCRHCLEEDGLIEIESDYQ